MMVRTETALRWSRMALVATVALFFTLVAFGNLTDYGSNFEFVRHVLAMDTTFLSPTLMWRAMTSSAVLHAAYVAIIAWQVATAVLCWWGLARLWRARSGGAALFQAAKGTAILGLSAGFLLYGAGFIGIGGEWFAMWQSSTWNGQKSAHIFLTLIGLALLHLSGREE
jgi:predicted small integral membrane protein